MKAHLIVPLTIIVSVALLGFMKVRTKEEEEESKRLRFQEIKLRVTKDVLVEYENELAEMLDNLVKAQTEQVAREKEVNEISTKADQVKGNVDVCQGEKKSEGDKAAAAETDLNNVNAELGKESNSWKEEEASLKLRLGARSVLCDYLKKDVHTSFCGEVLNSAPKEEEKKAEAPKQEEPKAEAPKQEEPKAEAPKQEEAKAEAPKQEEAKAEAPKQEEPKAEAPKQEEPKAEAPKQEEPKAEAPKQEEPKAEAPKQEEPKAEAPKQEEPKAEAPKQEEAKAEAPKSR